MWLYYYGMTERQVDLLLIDQPLVVYDHKNNKKSRGKIRRTNADFEAPSDYALEQTRLKWLEKHPDGNSTVKLDLSKFSLNGGS